MIVLEILMFTVMTFVSGISTITDFKSGLIKNKWVFPAFGVSLVLNSIYYGFFARDLLTAYLVNIGFSALLSLLLYGFHFWGAGDSKLLILISSLIPARLYIDSIIPIPTLLLIVFTFSIAFVYLVAESLVLGIKHKNLFDFSKDKLSAKGVLRVVYGYLSSYVYIVLINAIETNIFKNYVVTGGYIFVILNFFVVLTIFGFDFLRKWYVVLAVGIADLCFMLLGGGFSVKSLFSIHTIVVIAVVMLFRGIAEKYNYKAIPTDDIKEGQILSLLTVSKFQTSRVKGLPLSTTEDFRSRISADEVASIKRWKTSKNGENTVIIVRKLPFAVFITLGTVAFFLIMGLS